MSCSPERISSYRRHFHGSTSSLMSVKARVSSPSPVRMSVRSASYSMPATGGGRVSRATSSSNRGSRLPGVVAISSVGTRSGGFGKGAPTADLDAAAAENREFLSTRSGERQEMVVLNDRLAVYIEKVHSLEQHNTLLEADIEALLNRYVKPTGMRRLYEEQLKELLRIAEQARALRDLAVAAKEAMAAQLEEIRRQYEEALEQRKQAEMDLVALRPDVDRATSGRIALEQQLEQLQAEMEFLKSVHKEEIEELMQQIYSTVATAQSSFALPDLSSALKQIQTQYDDIAAKNLQQMDAWYGSKFEDMGNKSARNIDKLRSAREEMNNMKKDIQNKEQDLEGLRSKNDANEAQLREMQERHRAELEALKARIEVLQAELKSTKQKTAKLLHEYQELLNVKMALEVEIITYRKLIEGEDSRLTVSQLSLAGNALGASVITRSTTVTTGASVTTKNRGGSINAMNGGGSVNAMNGGGSVTAMNGDGSVNAKNGGGSVNGNNEDGSVTAKNGVAGTGSDESVSDANNADPHEGNGIGASVPGESDHSTGDGSDSINNKGIGKEEEDEGVNGVGVNNSNGLGQNGGESGAVEKCCHCNGVKRHGAGGPAPDDDAVEVVERKTVLIRTVRVEPDDAFTINDDIV